MDTTILGPIGQIALRVNDVAAATDWYRERLGLRHLFSAPTPGSGDAPGMAFFDCHGIRLLLGRPETPAEDHPGSTLYFTVPDIKAAHEALAERGVPFIETPRMIADLGKTELWLAFFRDPSDNVLALMSEVEKASTAKKQPPLHVRDQETPEPERPSRPAEEAGMAPHQLEDPPQAEGDRDDADEEDDG